MARQPVELALSAPVKAHGEEVSTLTLRPLTARDLRVHGLPFVIQPGGGREMNMAVVAAMVADLAGIPLSSVDQMDPFDLTAAMGVVLGFLAPTTPPTS